MRHRLLSNRFLWLYAGALAAVLLNYSRHWWGATSWFACAVGLTAAVILIALLHFLEEAVEGRRRSPRRDFAFFLLFTLLWSIAAIFMPRDDRNGVAAFVAALAMAAISVWAALGSLFQWPGFRQPPVEDDGPYTDDICTSCGHERSEFGTFCPVCGIRYGKEAKDTH